MPGRTQHYQQRQIDAPAQETYGHRGRPTATIVAAEAEPSSKIGVHIRRAPTGLSRIVSAVQNAAARTSCRSRLARQIRVNTQQQSEKIGILQEGMAHWNGLLASKPETPPTGAFVQAP